MAPATSAEEPPELSWIEIHSVTIVPSSNGKVGKIHVFIKDSQEPEEKEKKQTILKDAETEDTWNLSPKYDAFSMCVIRVTASFKRPFFGPSKLKNDEFMLNADDLISFCTRQSLTGRKFNYTASAGNSSTLSLKATSWDVSSFLVSQSTSFESTKLSKVLDGSTLLVDTANAFQQVFSKVEDSSTIEILDTVVNALETFTRAHPLIEIITKALLIPYKMWKEKTEFMDHLSTFASDMCLALKSFADAFRAMELEHTKESAMKLLKLIVDASKYVEGFVFVNKGQLPASRPARTLPKDILDQVKRFASTQFPKKLENYRNDMRGCRLDFREGVIIQTLVNSKLMKDRGDDLSYLRRKLDPPEQPPIDGGCLPGTRERFLSHVKSWLSSTAAEVPTHNVLWVSGAPGAGKTAFSSTVIKDLLGFKCAKFIIKRGNQNPKLSDPRAIWRSIAYRLADLDRGVKLDVLEVLSGEARHAYPEDADIESQFRQLILKPLNKHFATDRMIPKTITVVIDALDECEARSSSNERHWLQFLQTIVQWREELPWTCKLVVTSRVEAEIERRLKKFGFQLALDTGVDVSDESRNDIKLLFSEAFKGKGIRKTDIDALTRYAAGLFIWATTVIDFVRAGDPEERLREVLANMAATRDADNVDKIGMLYGRILFRVAWPRRSRPSELDRFSLVLASVVPDVLCRPLPLNVLGDLWSSNKASSFSDIDRVVDGLKSIIVTEGNDRVPRVRHNSFSDFLLDDRRVISVLNELVPDNNDYNRSNFLAAFSHVHQHAVLATVCLQLINVTAGDDFMQANSSASLKYACMHWADHLRGTIEDVNNISNSTIRLAPLVKTFAEEGILLWMEVLSQTCSVGRRFVTLRRHAAQLPTTFWTDDSVLNVLSSIATLVDTEALDLVAVVLDRFIEFRLSSNIVIKALLIPYQLSNKPCELRVIDDAKLLVYEICTSVKLMAKTFTELRRNIEDVKGCATNLLKAIIGASTLLLSALENGFRSKSSEVDGAPLIRNDVKAHLESLRGRHLDFKEGVLLLKLKNVGALETREDSIRFLRRKLKPPKPPLADSGCLPGTRSAVFSSVDKWLKSNNLSNILWISGAAGAGKTALASTIVAEQLHNFYSCDFFIKRRLPELNDPCAIWRSVAFKLAEMHQSVRVNALELILNGAYAKDASVEDQFRLLVLEPLKEMFSSEPAPSRNLVIVIDALDECVPKSDMEWTAFLGTIVRWREELPQTCKLVVTSRREKDIVKKLESNCFPLVLETGDVASQDSEAYADVHRFLAQELQTMSNVPGWPGPEVVARLAQAAAGIFVWATTFVEFIRHDPIKESEKILTYVGQELENDTAEGDNLGCLYGKIIFEVASQLPRPQGLNSLTVILASVTLLNKPISVQALCTLLPDHYSPSNFQHVLESLRSIIFTGKDDRNEGVRVCHKSVLDFLQDDARVENTMERILAKTQLPNDRSGLILASLSPARRNAVLEEGCLRLISRCCNHCRILLPEKNIAQDRWEQKLEEHVRRLMKGEQLERNGKATNEIDTLFLLADAWQLFPGILGTAAYIQSVEAAANAPLASEEDSDDHHYVLFSLMLMVPYTLWRRRINTMSDAERLQYEMCITPNSMVNTFHVMTRFKHTAIEILSSMVGALKQLDGFEPSTNSVRNIYPCGDSASESYYERDEDPNISSPPIFLDPSDVLSSEEADLRLGDLGVTGILSRMNAILKTSHILSPAMDALLCFCHNSFADFGQAFSLLRPRWEMDPFDALEDVKTRMEEDQLQRKAAVENNNIVDPHCPPRRLWDIKSNRVVPFWVTDIPFGFDLSYRQWIAVSHSWVERTGRCDVFSSVNGQDWPIPIPIGTSLEQIRSELLNLVVKHNIGTRFVWLDVLCLRQIGTQSNEERRHAEWRLDVPVIGLIYDRAVWTIYYFSGLGQRFDVSPADNNRPCHWTNRAWTLQEATNRWIVGGRDRNVSERSPQTMRHEHSHGTPVEDAIRALYDIYKVWIILKSRSRRSVFAILDLMRHRSAMSELDKIAGLIFFLNDFRAPVPAYIAGEKPEDAWDRLVEVTQPELRAELFFLFPQRGYGRHAWYPSWQQIKDTEVLPSGSLYGQISLDATSKLYTIDCICLERCRVEGLTESDSRAEDYFWGRTGNLVVEITEGETQNISVSTEYFAQLPDGYYTLIGESDENGETLGHWVVGRKTEQGYFEKVSAIEIEHPEDVMLAASVRRLTIRLV